MQVGCGLSEGQRLTLCISPTLSPSGRLKPGCHPSRGFRPVLGAVDVGTGEEPWVRTQPYPQTRFALPPYFVAASPHAERVQARERGAGALSQSQSY